MILRINDNGTLRQFDIAQMSDISNIVANEYDATSTYAVGDIVLYNGTLYKCTTAISSAEEWTVAHWSALTLSEDFVKKTDYATQSTGGVVKIIDNGSGGFQIDQGYLLIYPAQSYSIKSGSATTLSPIVPNSQHESTFYGLAKAAGDTSQAQSDNAVGVYTENAKTAIKNMLGVADTPPEIFVGATTPSGYTLYIDPDGGLPYAQGVNF